MWRALTFSASVMMAENMVDEWPTQVTTFGLGFDRSRAGTNLDLGLPCPLLLGSF